MRLDKFFIEKIWGRDVLPAPFQGMSDKRIGEVWFEPPAQLPELLVKYIFTSEKLSIQCHPSDAQTQAMGMGKQGKEECWLVLAAEEGAQLGIGFTEDIDARRMRAAAIDGTIETLLAWHDVKAGDFFYLTANTVHAIGGGLTIIEVQQNSDITYRLYDYGRPRELHLDEGIKTASGKRFDASSHQVAPDDISMSLVDGPYFRLDQIAGIPDAELRRRYPGNLLVIPREGEIAIGSSTCAAGDCAMANSIDDVVFRADTCCLLAAACPNGETA